MAVGLVIDIWRNGRVEDADPPPGGNCGGAAHGSYRDLDAVNCASR